MLVTTTETDLLSHINANVSLPSVSVPPLGVAVTETTFSRYLLPYNRERSKLLAHCCKLAVEQYEKGKKDPTYDGSITPPAGYIQIAAFKAPEIDISTTSQARTSVEELAKVYFGFALTSATNNIIALRGTQTVYEWVTDLAGFQINYDPSNDKYGKVHVGFYTIYEELAEQIRRAASKFSTLVPCYVTGHSLGSALAVLAATDIAMHVNGLKEQLQMYSYAGPRVGDPVFASFYNGLIPNSYRVVNLADVAPILPPTKILKYTYQHVGQEWSYLWQTGDIEGNHFLMSNYLPAVNLQVETDQPRRYPCPCS